MCRRAACSVQLVKWFPLLGPDNEVAPNCGAKSVHLNEYNMCAFNAERPIHISGDLLSVRDLKEKSCDGEILNAKRRYRKIM